MTDGARKYRVVQWATGVVGSRALRRVIEHPQLELVGVYVHSADKEGRDAGELAGTGQTGVKATRSIDQVIALKPDCVLYMPHVFNLDEVCRLLESGANVVSTRMELQNPAALDPAIAERLEKACQRGKSSVHASGSSPGFITEAVPFVFTSLLRRLDHYGINEFADCSKRLSKEMIFEMMGFGAKPGAEPIAHTDHAKSSFGPSLQLVATRLGLPMDSFETSGAVGLARNDVEIDVGVIPKGTVAATRTTLRGIHKGKPLMSFTSTWFVSTDIDTSDGQEWEFLRPSGWRVKVEGDTPLEATITFPIPFAEYFAMTPNLTAHRPVNAIPYVCEAAPGMCTTADLPQIIAKLG